MRWSIGLLACAAALGCHSTPHPASGGTGGTGGGGVDPARDKKCPPEFTIDDAEDKNHQLIKQAGRAGYWYTFTDKAGTTITPAAGAAGGKFAMSDGGASGSLGAARMNGKLSGAGDPIYAGMGLNFTDPKGPYDAHAYTGVSFWAKVGAGTANVRLKVPDINTDPEGKVCSPCFNDFGADLTFTTEWKKFNIPFASMKQLDGWGSPHPPAIDASKLYGLQWQVTAAGADFNVWIDDVQFTGCP